MALSEYMSRISWKVVEPPPFCSSPAKGWYELSAWLELEEGEDANQKERYRRWFQTSDETPPPHPLLVTALLFPSFSSARSRFLRVVVYARACVTTTARVKYEEHTIDAHAYISFRWNILRKRHTFAQINLSLNKTSSYLQILTIHLHCLQSGAAWFT